METTSINEALFAQFGMKKLSKADLSEVKSLTISRYDAGGRMQPIDFAELAFFPNLEEVLIRDCYLNDDDIGYITQAAKSIGFVRCNFEGVKAKAITKPLKKVYVSGCVGVGSHFNHSSLESLEIHGADLGEDFCPKAKNLNITGCSISNYDFLRSPPLKELTISDTQYQKNSKLYQRAPFVVRILEPNGEFEALRVGGRG